MTNNDTQSGEETDSPYEFGGEPVRTEDSVVRVELMSSERGETTRYLEEGDHLDMPADRVSVEALQPRGEQA